MKKSDIVKRIAKEKNISQNKAKLIVEGIFLAMTEALARGEKIEIRGLGSIRVKKKPSRIVKDPRTGAEIFVKERYVPVFKMGKLIKNHINNRKDEEG